MKLKPPPRRLRSKGSPAEAQPPTEARRFARRVEPLGRPFSRRQRPRASVAANFGLSSEEEAELGIGTRVVPQTHGFEEFPSVRPRSLATGVDVEAQLQALEARLDGLIRGAGEPHGLSDWGSSSPPPRSFAPEAVAVAEGALAPRFAHPIASNDTPAETVDATREVWNSPYFVKQWGRIALRTRSEEVDEFGLDPRYEARLRPFFDFLFRNYFRVTTPGIDNTPSEGAAVIVANHSGTLPLDGAMLRAAFRLHHPAHRDLRWLAEDFLFYLPFAGAFINRIGAVRACPENADRLLARDSLIAVFPEGDKGIKKLYRDRYKLQRFGRGGFVRLCLRTGAPLIPCAVVGAEETAPMVYRLEYLSELAGLPYVPITPTFPWFGPLGLLPAPTKWTMFFDEPMDLAQYGPEAADDHVLVGRLAEQVRSRIQEMIDRGVARRKSVWLG